MVKPKNMLRKKLCRDMSRAAMQFLSIIALCALGTFAFSALDGMARMIRTTLNTYYEENNLADFWITLPTADRASMEKLAALPDVEAVCARASVAPRRRFRFRHGLRRRNDHQQAAAARGRAA